MYKIHIIKQQKYSNGTIGWITDRESGDCFDLIFDSTDEEITAAVSISDVHYKLEKNNDDYDIYFYAIEFDNSENYRIRKISFDKNGTIKVESFDKLTKKFDARDNLICKEPVIVKDDPTTTKRNEITSDRDGNGLTTKKAKPAKSKTKGWVYVILVLCLIFIIIAIVSVIYWYTQRNSSQQRSTEESQTANENIEMTDTNTQTAEQTGTKDIDNKSEATDTDTSSSSEYKEQPTKPTQPVPLQSAKEEDL